MSDLLKIGSSELHLGEPLPFSIYDEKGTLLLKAGVILTRQLQLDRLRERGLFLSQKEVSARRHTTLSDKVAVATPISVFDEIENIKPRLNRIFYDLQTANNKDVFERLDAVVISLQHACASDTDSALASLHLDYESPYSVVHHLQAAMLCELIGKKLGIKDAERGVLIKAALTHDIGLFDIQNILDRQVEPLSDTQKARVKSHPDDSVKILSKLGITDRIWLNVVQNHHERIDGTGYPQGSLGENISAPARILAVADIYSAMVRDRPYRKAIVSKDAMRQMLIDHGKTTDAHITQLMIKEVGVFPPGSIVKLCNGEVAVVKERGENTAHPLVYAFVKPDGMPRLTPVKRMTSNPDCTIEGMVPYSKYKAATSVIRSLWVPANK